MNGVFLQMLCQICVAGSGIERISEESLGRDSMLVLISWQGCTTQAVKRLIFFVLWWSCNVGRLGLFDLHSVDGRNPAPVDMVDISLFTGFHAGFLPPTEFVALPRLIVRQRFP